MADTTPVLGLPFPEITDPGPPDVAGDIEALAEAVDTAIGAFKIPQLLTAVDMVPLLPVGLPVSGRTFGTAGDVADLEQGAVLCRLPRRIVGATRIRWKHKHGNPAAAGNFALSIYDDAGDLIIGTGAVAFTGAADSIAIRSHTIAATTFEAGMYYVHFGIDTSAGSGSTDMALINNAVAGDDLGPAYPNVALRSATGGATAPANLLSMTDVGASTVETTCGVPLIALSVG